MRPRRLAGRLTSRPEFGPAMRQVLIGLLIILMLRFRPQGIFRERPGIDGRQGLAGRLGLLRARGAVASADSQPAGTSPAAAGAGAEQPGGTADGLPARAAGGAARDGQTGQGGSSR